MKYTVILIWSLLSITQTIANDNKLKQTQICSSCELSASILNDKSYFCEDLLFNESQPNEEDLIRKTIQLYIDGTSIDDPDKLRKAFHKDLNLYAINSDGTLKVWKGEDYIKLFKKGQRHNRVGKILSIEYENNIAIAKASIKTPVKEYIDYFMLAKISGEWKIIHKSYTVISQKK